MFQTFWNKIFIMKNKQVLLPNFFENRLILLCFSFFYTYKAKEAKNRIPIYIKHSSNSITCLFNKYEILTYCLYPQITIGTYYIQTAYLV